MQQQFPGFVFTLGGYHPDFHRNGYPVVPRLGLRWSIGSAITIKAGSYFALTSEALMAGGRRGGLYSRLVWYHIGGGSFRSWLWTRLRRGLAMG